MSKIIVFEHLTLDGVMQAPGRPDEDLRSGFAHGGWARPRGDAVMGSAAAESMANVGALLLGRRTYEDFYAYWPNQPEPNPFTAVLNNSQWRNHTAVTWGYPSRPIVARIATSDSRRSRWDSGNVLTLPSLSFHHRPYGQYASTVPSGQPHPSLPRT